MDKERTTLDEIGDFIDYQFNYTHSQLNGIAWAAFPEVHHSLMRRALRRCELDESSINKNECNGIEDYLIDHGLGHLKAEVQESLKTR